MKYQCKVRYLRYQLSQMETYVAMECHEVEGYGKANCVAALLRQGTETTPAAPGDLSLPKVPR